MKKIYVYIILCLLICLYIYLFYRTEKTVINEILISIISLEKFAEIRNTISGLFPLHKQIINSLPEGLWVFCITLTSKSLYVNVGRREMNLLFVPLIFAFGLELLQLLHLTNGRFDLWDIAYSVLFWAAANYLIKDKLKRQDILNPFTTNSMVCIFSYLIVYLAHVWK
ncbi:MAG: hypothetical protein HOP11_04525 [Saprospiraceae bacterium]|nr:hypothetical protein [Saprospiraceae bacterium]